VFGLWWELGAYSLPTPSGFPSLARSLSHGPSCRMLTELYHAGGRFFLFPCLALNAMFPYGVFFTGRSNLLFFDSEQGHFFIISLFVGGDPLSFSPLFAPENDRLQRFFF